MRLQDRLTDEGVFIPLGGAGGGKGLCSIFLTSLRVLTGWNVADTFFPHLCGDFQEGGRRWGKRPEPVLCVKGENFELKKKKKKTTLAFICRLCDKNTL